MVRGLMGSGAGNFTLRENKKEYFRAYYKKNKDKIVARNKAKYDANPEKYRKIRRQYYQTQKEIQADYLNSIRPPVKKQSIQEISPKD